MADRIQFWLNDRSIEVEGVAGTTTLLRYLRDEVHLVGTKEGCGEGDCGACTVAFIERRDDGSATFRAVNSCLMFLPMCQGKRLYTVEALRDRADAFQNSSSGFHAVQRAMVDRRGSQCGYCTPGIIMSLFEACYREDMGAEWQLDDQMCGNLCRCTGYRPIREATRDVAGQRPDDRFMAELRNHREGDASLQGVQGTYLGQPQQYFQPATLDELWAIRAAHPQAILVAGGTDLGLWVTKFRREMPVVIGLEALDVLKELTETASGWRVGAGVSLTRVHEVLGPELPGVDRMMRVFGSRQIRSRATVGGNICNASPIGDTPPLWLALDATAIVVGPAGERRVPMSVFFLGYRETALQGDEILLAIEVPRPKPGAFFHSYKVSKRREMDISAVAAAMYVDTDGDRVTEVRLAYGGVAATPYRAQKTEAFLMGKPWTEATVEAAMQVLDAEVAPISDHRGSARFRSLLARNLLRGFFLESQGGAPVVADRPSGTMVI